MGAQKELNGRSYRCSFELTLSVVGGKWKPVILYFLSQKSVFRFGEMKKAIPAITQRMLTKQLRELESDGVVYREVYRQVPPKVEYSLTPLGKSLMPVFNMMRDWGMEYEAHFSGEAFSEKKEGDDGKSAEYAQLLECGCEK